MIEKNINNLNVLDPRFQTLQKTIEGILVKNPKGISWSMLRGQISCSLLELKRSFLLLREKEQVIITRGKSTYEGGRKGLLLFAKEYQQNTQQLEKVDWEYFLSKAFGFVQLKKNVPEEFGTHKKIIKFLFTHPDSIEDGFKVLASEIWFSSGRIDILGLDKNNQICIVEVTTTGNDKRRQLKSYKESIEWIALNVFHINKPKIRTMIVYSTGIVEEISEKELEVMPR